MSRPQTAHAEAASSLLLDTGLQVPLPGAAPFLLVDVHDSASGSRAGAWGRGSGGEGPGPASQPSREGVRDGRHTLNMRGTQGKAAIRQRSQEGR